MSNVRCLAVAQIWSKQGPRVQAEIQDTNRAVFQPSYKKRWLSAGKLSKRHVALMPGYLFFEDNGLPPKDARGHDIEGIIRVLPGLARKDEYDRLRLACDLKLYDDKMPIIAAEKPEEPQAKRRRHRPSRRARPGKWARMRDAERKAL